MTKLIIEIDIGTESELEAGDIENILNFGVDCSLYIEFGKPHSNQELADNGIAETFAIDVQKYNVRIEE